MVKHQFHVSGRGESRAPVLAEPGVCGRHGTGPSGLLRLPGAGRVSRVSPCTRTGPPRHLVGPHPSGRLGAQRPPKDRAPASGLKNPHMKGRNDDPRSRGRRRSSWTARADEPPPPRRQLPTPTTTVPKRTITGKLTTLGAGNFTVGRDIPAGLYNVTAGAGQSGNFIVTGNDTYDEILGSADGLGVPEVRARLQKGDKIQLAGLSSVIFTPVATPYVTVVKPVDLYAGTCTVGQDIAPVVTSPRQERASPATSSSTAKASTRSSGRPMASACRT